jgi:hypothetical protein
MVFGLEKDLVKYQRFAGVGAGIIRTVLTENHFDRA